MGFLLERYPQTEPRTHTWIYTPTRHLISSLFTFCLRALFVHKTAAPLKTLRPKTINQNLLNKKLHKTLRNTKCQSWNFQKSNSGMILRPGVSESMAELLSSVLFTLTGCLKQSLRGELSFLLSSLLLCRFKTAWSIIHIPFAISLTWIAYKFKKMYLSYFLRLS